MCFKLGFCFGLTLRPMCSKKHYIFFHDFHFQTKAYNFYLCVGGKKCNKLFRFSSQIVFTIEKYKPVLNENCSTKTLLSKSQLKK